MALLIYAHPYPSRSRANRALLDLVSKLDGVTTHSLYDLYPDFDIDVEKEQAALSRNELIIWQHPMHWYSVPSLLKHWIDKVLLRGWAYGTGGTALRGKRCLWVTTTGGDDSAFSPQGMHAFPFSSFVPAIEQTARFCGMQWEEPLVLHSAHKVSEEALDNAAHLYRTRVRDLIELVEGAAPAATVGATSDGE
jgi:glutathione-regulated potassium-efflux system ancillary protein KefF